jgi:hypothetical protein
MGDVDSWIEQLKNGENLKETDVKLLCNKAREILQAEDNVIRVEAPITVCHRCLPFRFVATSTANSTI